MVAHFVRDEGVAGSNPVIPTIALSVPSTGGALLFHENSTQEKRFRSFMSVLRQPQLVHSEYRFRTTMLFASLLCVLAVAIILGLVAFDSSGMMSTMVALSAVGLLIAGIVEFQVGFTIRERNRQEDQPSLSGNR